METVRSLAGVSAGSRVRERAAGGGKGDPEAFRRALQQGAEARAEAAAGEESPLRTRLQSRADHGRKDAGTTARHVDVLA